MKTVSTPVQYTDGYLSLTEPDMCCLAWVSVSLILYWNVSILKERRKVLLLIYCAMDVVIMHKHGGIHGWDLTQPQKSELLYVSIEVSPTRVLRRLNTYKLVVQCAVSRLRASHPDNKIGNPSPLPPRLLAAPRRNIRSQYPHCHDPKIRTLPNYHGAQDLGVHTKKEDLGQVNPEKMP